MTSVSLESVCVDFPVFNTSARSIKNRLINVATGGIISTQENGRINVRSLDNVTLKIDEGERVGLLGHNGAGKTTLLRVLSRAYFPTGGTATIHGRIGSLIDISLGIDPEATGRENILLRGAMLGISPKEIRGMAGEIAEFSELGSFLDLPLRTYSSGMQLRLAFAVSTIVNPEILLMDEWLSVGDASFKEKAEARLVDFITKSKILILAAHTRDLLLKTCTRGVLLEHGRVVLDGAIDHVCSAYFRR